MGFGGIFGGPGAFKVVKGSKQLNGVSKKKAAKRGGGSIGGRTGRGGGRKETRPERESAEYLRGVGCGKKNLHDSVTL
jgi:hypothetical protein